MATTQYYNQFSTVAVTMLLTVLVCPHLNLFCTKLVRYAGDVAGKDEDGYGVQVCDATMLVAAQMTGSKKGSSTSAEMFASFILSLPIHYP